MKSALFSKLSLLPLLVAAGMAGCGDTGNGGGDNSGGPCQDGTISVCQCPPGVPGVQLCQGGVLGPCNCSGTMGTGAAGGGTPLGSGGFPQGGAPPGGAVCGDGIITPPEECDGQNQNGMNCQSVSMGTYCGGQLYCNGTCHFGLDMCTPCGGGGVGGTMGGGGTFGGGGVGGTTGQP